MKLLRLFLFSLVIQTSSLYAGNCTDPFDNSSGCVNANSTTQANIVVVCKNGDQINMDGEVTKLNGDTETQVALTTLNGNYKAACNARGGFLSYSDSSKTKLNNKVKSDMDLSSAVPATQSALTTITPGTGTVNYTTSTTTTATTTSSTSGGTSCTGECDCGNNQGCIGGFCQTASPVPGAQRYESLIGGVSAWSGSSWDDTGLRCPNLDPITTTSTTGATTCATECDCSSSSEACVNGVCVDIAGPNGTCTMNGVNVKGDNTCKWGCNGGNWTCTEPACKALVTTGGLSTGGTACSTACDCPNQYDACIAGTCVDIEGSSAGTCTAEGNGHSAKGDAACQWECAGGYFLCPLNGATCSGPPACTSPCECPNEYDACIAGKCVTQNQSSCTDGTEVKGQVGSCTYLCVGNAWTCPINRPICAGLEKKH